MNLRKRAIRVVAVLAVAFAAGQVAETLRVPSQVVGASVGAGDLASVALAEGLLNLRGITPVAATMNDPAAAGCVPGLKLEAAPAGMIDLVLNAPCNRGERVVIRHAGLSFTSQTSPEGMLHLQLPALEADALVAAYFDGAQIALAKVAVPDAADHTRFAVQMAYPAQFDLRAEADGQVSVGSYGRTAAMPGRSIQPLGLGTVSQPMLAQVYSYPSDSMSADLTVEIKITAETCGRTLPVETLLARDGRVSVTKLSVAVPLCGTSGDILVLKNLVRDLTLAAPR
jgi:hypothetical protein